MKRVVLLMACVFSGCCAVTNAHEVRTVFHTVTTDVVLSGVVLSQTEIMTTVNCDCVVGSFVCVELPVCVCGCESRVQVMAKVKRINLRTNKVVLEFRKPHGLRRMKLKANTFVLFRKEPAAQIEAKPDVIGTQVREFRGAEE